MRPAVALFVVCAAAACSGHSSSKPSGQEPAAVSTTAPHSTTTRSPAQVAADAAAATHVAITACAPDAHHNVEVRGTARNTTATRAGFVIEVEIRDPSGSRVFATVAAVNKVEPATTARWDAPTTARYVAGMQCTVMRVAQRPS